MYDLSKNVSTKIRKAMNVKSFKADYQLTENKIDEIRLSNMKPNEVNSSVFTSTLEKYINNVGLTMPYDSDPGFYRDHYDREVKLRNRMGSKDDFYVAERVSSLSKRDSSHSPDIPESEQTSIVPLRRVLNV